jgi:hypothetical protein
VVKPVAARPQPKTAPAVEDQAALVESIVRSHKKRIMGRKRSLPDVERIVTLVGPLVTRALEQPSIQDDLRVLAEQEGMSLAEYKQYFQRKQEADLLLESGGDPNARSPSDAIGVAQFLASTGRSSGGLQINVAEGRRLTWQIARMHSQIAALQALPENWTKPLPGLKEPKPVLIAARPTDAAQVAGRSKGTGARRPPARGSLTSRGTRADRRAATAAPVVPEPQVSMPIPAFSPPNGGDARPLPSPAPGSEAAGLTPAASFDPAKGENGTSAPLEGPGAPPATTEPGTPAPAVEDAPAPAPAKPPVPTPKPAPLTPRVITRDELVAKRVNELRLLEAKRRQADERYDPAKAIAAQTRYMVRLARRYGSLDWVFQAYHGGEGGVRNTVSYYLGDQWRRFASIESAIRGIVATPSGAQRVRPPLSFEDLYVKVSPVSHPAAFSYVYGRSDNHRFYWWKVLAAERAIALYRQDPSEFREQWRALRPGQRLEVVWYPNSKELNFRDVAALKKGYASGELVRWPANAKARGLILDDPAPLDPANAFHYKGLRPEAMGALHRVAAVYFANGGTKLPLRIHSLVQTEQYRARLNATRPPAWMRRLTKPEDIPIDMQPTGLCFDIVRPTTNWNRKVLEYALSYLADRNQIYYVEEREQGPRRYHVCPSPEFRQELARAARPLSGRE